MANSLQGIPREPVDNSGGIKYFLIAPFDSVKVIITDGEASVTLADGTAITTDDANTPFKKYVTKKESSQMDYVRTSTAATGSTGVDKTATLVFSKLEKAKVVEFEQFVHMESVIIGIDWADIPRIMGHEDGADLRTDTFSTGVAKGDLNGNTVVFGEMGIKGFPVLADGVLETLIPA